MLTEQINTTHNMIVFSFIATAQHIPIYRECKTLNAQLTILIESLNNNQAAVEFFAVTKIHEKKQQIIRRSRGSYGDWWWLEEEEGDSKGERINYIDDDNNIY